MCLTSPLCPRAEINSAASLFGGLGTEDSQPWNSENVIASTEK